VLFDQGSSNGTFVDGGRLTTGHAHVLRDGQIIRMGSSEFRVRLETSEPSAPGPAKPATEVLR
jgi:pSer/pThr/pTyr-binding forkhead associated (FHA) protein